MPRELRDMLSLLETVLLSTRSKSVVAAMPLSTMLEVPIC